MERFSDQSCRAFAAALASSRAVPGGGGASALAGALGAALCSMVGSLTVGKPKYAAAEAEVLAIMAEAEALREKLLDLVEADALAFAPLSRAYAIPKDDPTRGAVLEECLRRAAEPPLEMMRLSCQAIRLHQAMLEKGSAMMLSDVGTGAVLCWGALYGACLNVKVNTNLMADREYAQAVNREADALVEEHWKIAEAVYASVMRRYV